MNEETTKTTEDILTDETTSGFHKFFVFGSAALIAAPFYIGSSIIVNRVVDLMVPSSSLSGLSKASVWLVKQGLVHTMASKASEGVLARMDGGLKAYTVLAALASDVKDEIANQVAEKKI